MPQAGDSQAGWLERASSNDVTFSGARERSARIRDPAARQVHGDDVAYSAGPSRTIVWTRRQDRYGNVVVSEVRIEMKQNRSAFSAWARIGSVAVILVALALPAGAQN